MNELLNILFLLDNPEKFANFLNYLNFTIH